MIPDEGQTVERKQSLGEWSAIVETCAAFATAQGGQVYVGVKDDGTVLGVQIGKGTLEDLANKIAQNTSPRLVPSITTHQVEGRTVIVIEVQGNRAKPVYAFDRPLSRSGRTNQRLSVPEAAELYFSSRGQTWDETPLPEATLQDIDAQRVRRFLERAKAERQWNVDAGTSVEQALRQLNLLRDEKPTVAAVLLFGENPQRFLLQAKFRCARFKGDDTVDFLDMKVMESTVIDQVEEAMAFVRRHISMAVTIEEKLERTERWEYPLDAIREAITNAVCHRDYASSSNVQVRIFDHSLEVWNPGELPPGLTVDDLRRTHESKPRNKLVAEAFFLIKYIEQFGTGTGRMIEDCRQHDVPEPQFESRANTFRIAFQKLVSLPERLMGLELNERQRTALPHVEKRGRLTRREYETITGAPTATAKRDLSELVKCNVLVTRGRGRSVSYELAAQIVSRKVSRENPGK